MAKNGLLQGTKRVDVFTGSTVTEGGTQVSSTNPFPVKELGAGGVPISSPGRSKSYEDTSFVLGDSPVTLDVNTDLGRNATDGYIINDGIGNFTVAFSDNGTDFGDEHTLKKRERINLKNLNIDSIRITWVSDAAYRVLVV